jgi:RNA polymerase sigma factor (sigma-70 family)
MDESARYRWIAAHILPHEPELRGWLRRRLGSFNDNDVDDLVQESFARIWAADFSTIRNGRAYLYATVRHLLAEYARRSRIVPIELLGEIDSLNLISDEPGPERRVSARQELERLQAIVALLPLQCRRVFELLKFEGLSHRDVAQSNASAHRRVDPSGSANQTSRRRGPWKRLANLPRAGRCAPMQANLGRMNSGNSTPGWPQTRVISVLTFAHAHNGSIWTGLQRYADPRVMPGSPPISK